MQMVEGPEQDHGECKNTEPHSQASVPGCVNTQDNRHTAPSTPDSADEEQMFAGEGPVFNDTTHELTGLSCGQLDDPIVLGKQHKMLGQGSQA